MRWGNGPCCPHCECAGNIAKIKNEASRCHGVAAGASSISAPRPTRYSPEATYPITSAGSSFIFSPRPRRGCPRINSSNIWNTSKRRRGIWRIGFENAWSKGATCWTVRWKRTKLGFAGRKGMSINPKSVKEAVEPSASKQSGDSEARRRSQSATGQAHRKGHASKRNQGEYSARLRSIYRRIEVLRRPFKDTATSSSSIQLRDMFAGQAIPTTLSPPGRYPSAAITESITG